MKQSILGVLVVLGMAPVGAAAHKPPLTPNQRQFIYNAVPFEIFVKEAVQAKTCGMRTPTWAGDVGGRMAGAIASLAQQQWKIGMLRYLPPDGQRMYIFEMGEFGKAMASGDFVTRTICLHLAADPSEMGFLDKIARENGWNGH